MIAFVGVAAYYVVQNHKVLPTAEASNLIQSSLKNDGPVTIQFKVGMVVGSVQDRPHGPNYRLLEKAGLIMIGKDKGRITPITLTASGLKLMADLPGVSQTKDAKGRHDLLRSTNRDEETGRHAERDDDRHGLVRLNLPGMGVE